MEFFIFSIFFAGLLYAHFSIAHVAWSETRGNNSQELDMSYVRVENYFGQSFRRKVNQWLKGPGETSSTGAMRVVDRGNEKVYVAGSAQYPSNRRERNVLVIEGDFSCGKACSFERELMIEGNATIGAGTDLQAIAVDRNLTMEPGVSVRRWVDAKGTVELIQDCSVQSKVCAGHSIFMGTGCAALSFFAPEISTEGRVEVSTSQPERPGDFVLIPHAANMGNKVFHGYDPRLLYSMGGGTFLYNGDLKLTAPLHVRAPLVVRGNIEVIENCMLEADVKAHGSIQIGDGSILKGNLVSGGNMEIGSGSFFQSVLHSGGELRLKHGVRGWGKSPVVAYASETLWVESNVVVRGKLASAEKVKATSAPLAWLKNEFGD